MVPVKNIVNERFESMSLKENPVLTKDAAPQVDMQQLKDCLYVIDDSVDFSKLTTADLKNYANLHKFIEQHCKSTCYGFQIKR